MPEGFDLPMALGSPCGPKGDRRVRLDWIKTNRNLLQFGTGLVGLLILILLHLLFGISVGWPWAVIVLICPALIALSLAEQYLAAERLYEQDITEESAQ